MCPVLTWKINNTLLGIGYAFRELSRLIVKWPNYGPKELKLLILVNETKATVQKYKHSLTCLLPKSLIA